MDESIIKEILTTYWSQTTFILLGLGFLIKSIIDLKSKKTEINHNLFQQRKMDTVSQFFSITAKVNQMWMDLREGDIFEHKLTAKEIDNYIFPFIDELRRNIFELKIYFEKNEHSKFENVLKNFLKINSELCKTYFDDNKSLSILIKCNDFRGYRDEILQQNDKLLNEISESLRYNFK